MYFMSDPQALHVTRNVIPGKLGVDLHLHRVHIPLVQFSIYAVNFILKFQTITKILPIYCRGILIWATLKYFTVRAR